VATAFVLAVGISSGALAVGSYLLVRQARLDAVDSQAVSQTLISMRFAAKHRNVDELLVKQRWQATPVPTLVLARGVPPRTSAHVTSDIIRNNSLDPASVLAAADKPGAIGARQIPSDLLRLVGQGKLAREQVIASGRHYDVVGAPLPLTPEQFYFFYDDQQVWHDLDYLRNVLVVVWLGLLVLAGLGGTLFARRTLAPVADASDAARRLAEGLLDTRLPVESRDEFGAWAAAFNDMASALQAKITALAEAQERERRFTANVAHDLRSPLTALIGEARQLTKQAHTLPPDTRRLVEMLVADVDRLCRLAEDLLEISRLDAGLEPPEPEPVDAAALVEGVLRSNGCFETVKLDAQRFMLTTDPRRLERIVANLVENAVTHGGGNVRVRVARDGDQAIIEVADHGPGIPAAVLPHIFDRQFKADTSRGSAGSGLGLAIARDNALLLGGEITVASPPNDGAVFTLRLPVAEPLPDGDRRAIDDPDNQTGGRFA
jgi:two-component system sensor histidine kinase MtrB